MLNRFNFSYSTYDNYCKSQLWFYFMKILKAEETDKGMQVYGDAGNVVHSAIEDFINNKEDTFDKYWKKFKIDSQEGFNNKKLSKDNFYTFYKKAIKYLSTIKYKSCKTELKIEKRFLDMNFKAFIDLYTETENDIIIYDWKTNSSHDNKTHIKQRLLYSWLVWKIKGKIPICKWVYLGNMDIVEDKFLVKELNIFEKEILNFKKEIQEKGDDIKKYIGGDWKNPFNKYYRLCMEEMEKREASDYMEIHLSIKGNFVFFEGDVNPKLEEGIDYRTKFDLKDKYFMQQAVKNKAKGYINLSDVGTVHFYNKKFKCFPIGLLNKVKEICNEFGTYYNKEIKLIISDCRDISVMNMVTGLMPEKLHTDKKIRDYQLKAVNKFIENKTGIINIPTGSGKTFTAAEILRQIDGKTLWIIDRKELLIQTKKVLEKLLGVKIGIIADGEVDIKNITIATIQSLNSKIKDLQDYFYIINCVVVDEFHKSAAETYQKVFAKLPNTKYRLGLTATVARDDGKDPILFSILGEIVYKCSTADLIKMGYLVKPTIQFYKVIGDSMNISYQEDYNINIVEKIERNEKIKEIVKNNNNKKIMILTKLVNHGKMLCKDINGSKHIHGKSKDRKKVMEDFRNDNFNILIGTISIFAEGIDLENLDIIINAAANKGDVKSIQILGRVLRTFKNKDSALYIDFFDCGKHTKKHSNARIKAFKKQGHEVIII